MHRRRDSLLLQSIAVVIVAVAGILPALADKKAPSTVRCALAHVTHPGGERAFDSPRDVSIISPKERDDRAVTTTSELLDETPGLSILRPSPAEGTPILRGLLGRRALVFVDGVRLTTALSPLGPNPQLATLDPFALARVEILHGAGTVFHGADALAGVIDITTHAPHFDPWHAWDASGGALGRFASASTGLVSHAFAEGHLRSVGLRLGGTLRRFGDLRTGGSWTKRPFTRSWDGAVNLSGAWAINQRTELRLGYTAFRQHDTPRADRSTLRDFTLLRDRLRDTLAVHLSRKSDTAWLRQLVATISFHNQRQLAERLRLDADSLTRERDGVSSVGARVFGKSNLPHNEITYGTDFSYDMVTSTAEDERISEPLRTPRSRGHHLDGSTLGQVGFFAHDQLLLLDKRLAITLGGRLTTWWTRLPADPSGSPAFDKNTLGATGHLQVRYLVGDGLNLHAGLTRGFAPPNIDDYTARGCGDQGFELPPSSLGNEKSLGAEAGAKLDLFGNLTGRFAYFFTYLDEPIVRRRVPGGALLSCGGALVPLVRRSNAPSATIHGVEGQLHLSLNAHFSLFTWLAWTRGTVNLDAGATEPLSRTPPLNGLVGVRYQRGDDLFLELIVRWATHQDRLSDLDRADQRICPQGAAACRGTDGYTILRLRGGIKLAKPLSLTFAINNLTNQAYRSHGSGVDAAAFDARLGLELAL